MNQKICSMLRIIVSRHRQPVQIIDLAQMLSVSEKTVSNYWKEIEVFLSQENLDTAIEFDGKQFEFTGTSRIRFEISRLIANMDFYCYQLNEEERAWVITALLCTSSAPIKIRQIEDLLYISRTTAINDIKNVRLILKQKSGISFNDDKHLGFEIRCSEYCRRDLILQLAQVCEVFKSFQSSSFNFSPLPAFFQKLFFTDQIEKQVKSSICYCERIENFHFTDTQYYTLMFLVCLCVSSVRSGNSISAFHTKISENEPSRQLASAIYARLNGFSYSDWELVYLAQKISELGLVGRNTGTQQSSNSYIKFLTDSLLTALSYDYNMDLLCNDTLRENLSTHIQQCMYHRKNQTEDVYLPSLHEVIRQYPSEAKALQKHIYILEHGLNISFNSTETALILVHILASIEQKNLYQLRPKLIVACNAGLATGNLLASLIQKSFDVEIVNVCSVHTIEEALCSTPANIIISTIPVEAAVPVIVINAIPSEKDIKELRSTLKSLHNSRMDLSPILRNEISVNRVASIQLTELLPPSRIILDASAETWEDAITKAGQLLYQAEIVSATYLKSMVDLVHRYGPYVVLAKGIAFAHASPEDGMIHPGISLVRLKKAVTFGSPVRDPVSIIFACALPDNPAYTSTLLELMQKARQPNFLENIMCAHNVSEVMDKLR